MKKFLTCFWKESKLKYMKSTCSLFLQLKQFACGILKYPLVSSLTCGDKASWMGTLLNGPPFELCHGPKWISTPKQQDLSIHAIPGMLVNINIYQMALQGKKVLIVRVWQFPLPCLISEAQCDRTKCGAGKWCAISIPFRVFPPQRCIDLISRA